MNSSQLRPLLQQLRVRVSLNDTRSPLTAMTANGNVDVGGSKEVSSDDAVYLNRAASSSSCSTALRKTHPARSSYKWGLDVQGEEGFWMIQGCDEENNIPPESNALFVSSAAVRAHKLISSRFLLNSCIQLVCTVYHVIHCTLFPKHTYSSAPLKLM